MATHEHHDHGHSELDATELRVRALQTLLAQKGYIDPAALDAIVDTYQTAWARATARAWSPAPGATRPFATG